MINTKNMGSTYMAPKTGGKWMTQVLKKKEKAKTKPDLNV
jgi:hypothetical protein